MPLRKSPVRSPAFLEANRCHERRSTAPRNVRSEEPSSVDAFLSLPKWHQWQDLLQLAHLVVAHRPGWRAPGMGPLGELLVDRGTGRIGDLHEQRAGCIYIHAVTQLEISSTEVRQLIAMGRDPRFLMPDSVRKLILDTHCYAKTRTP